MSGCLDNVQCECGFEWREKRNSITAIISGVLVCKFFLYMYLGLTENALCLVLDGLVDNY